MPPSDPLESPADPQPVLTGGGQPAQKMPRPLPALALGIAVVLLVYLAFAVPASWFPSSPVKQWGVRDLTLPRGTGGAVNNDAMAASTIAMPIR